MRARTIVMVWPIVAAAALAVLGACASSDRNRPGKTAYRLAF